MDKFGGVLNFRFCYFPFSLSVPPLLNQIITIWIPLSSIIIVVYKALLCSWFIRTSYSLNSVFE